MDGRSRRFAILAILAVALVLRLVAGLWWQNRLPPGTQFAFGDSDGYWQLARSIAQGQPYRYGEDLAIFRTPGYPLLLAPIFLVLGPDPPVMAARALSAVLGTASIAAVMALARTLFNEPFKDRIALLAGVATAIDPGSITNGVFVLSEAPFCPLMVLNLWAYVLAWKAPSRRTLLSHAAWGGFIAGVATLMRPSWLLFLPFAAVVGVAYLMFTSRSATLGKWLGVVTTMLLTFSLTMAPWWIRNYSITRRFIPTTLQVGASLYDGLNPRADGSSNMDFVPLFITEQQAADALTVQPATDTFEERLDQRMRTAALDWAAANPRRVAELVVVKFVRMWSPWPNAGELGSFWAKLAIAAGYVPLIGLGLIGVWRYGRRDWSYALLLLPAIYFTLLHVIFVSSLRYRQPAMLALAILAAAVAVELIDKIWKGKPSWEGEAPAEP